MKKIQQICEGTELYRDVPSEAIDIAKKIGAIIIVGGSDDLMYCFGAESYLTKECEHGYGWDGCNLEDIPDNKLEKEAEQLGLKIWWCGEIKDDNLEIPNYNTDESGGFYYTVKENIEHLRFKVKEDDTVYCTGIIIKLPPNFKSSI